MKKLLIATFALLALSACKQPKPHPVNKLYKPSDEAEITTLAFHYIMPSDSAFKDHLLKHRFPASQSDNIAKLKNTLDTATLYVFIADTLMRLPNDYLKKQAKALQHTDADMIRNIVTENWASEIVINERPGLFQMSNLAFSYNYQYTLFTRSKQLPQDMINAGLFRMSGVFFNQGHTKAFIYLEKRGGNVVAMAYDMFLEKKKGKWFVTLCSLDWAS